MSIKAGAPSRLARTSSVSVGSHADQSEGRIASDGLLQRLFPVAVLDDEQALILGLCTRQQRLKPDGSSPRPDLQSSGPRLG